ncbi:MAG: hypothetical protein CVU32_01210 [Betaproteobacteria bacterium HGW-Betaproteobacteria-5]|nr:MAG: hypothetical protein CVU32_01210 [Betaproteobacteria bacterium HGW-Betaproteobacteria-5]PKO40985.1 MAG: hypothetical protein CVU33_01330 [Betaproteobacteria bacterium HGW-Betaproteobacteria-6]
MTTLSKLPSWSLVSKTQIHYVVAGFLYALVGLSEAVAPGTTDALEVPAKQSARAQKALMSGISANGKRAIAVGARGTILYSRDSGITWTQASVPVSSDLATVRFSDADTAWAIGHDAVLLRSDDAGEHWNKVLDGRSVAILLQSHYKTLADGGQLEAGRIQKDVEDAVLQSATPGVLSYPFLDIRINEKGEGFLAGAFGLLLRTIDAGKTWEPWIERAGNDRRMHLYALEQVENGSLYLAGEQGLIRRYDPVAGRFVVVEVPYNGTFFGLRAIGTKLIAFGLRGNAFISTDDAKSWRPVTLGVTANIVATLQHAPNEMLFVMQNGQVLLSKDDGRSVTDLNVPRGGEILGAELLGSDQLALARVNGAHLLRFTSP